VASSWEHGNGAWGREIEYVRNECLLLWKGHDPWSHSVNRVVSQLRMLVVNFQPRWPEFYPQSGHVGFMVDKASLRQAFSGYFNLL
jgi:hypothetical protein